MKKATGTVSRSICVSGRDYFVKAFCEGQLVDNGIGPWECHGRTGVDRRMEMEVTCMEVESVELPSGIVLRGSELLDRYPNIHAIFEDAIFEAWAEGLVEVDWIDDEPMSRLDVMSYADLYGPELTAELLERSRSRTGVQEDTFRYGAAKAFAMLQASNQAERIGAIESKMDTLYSLYLVVVWSDVDPEIEGPFESQEARMERAKALRSEFGEENGLYKLDIRRDGVPEMIPFATGDFSNLNQ